MRLKKIMKTIIPFIGVNEKILLNYSISTNLYKKGFNNISKIFTYKIYRKYKCHISQKSFIDKNLFLPHPISIVIGEGVKIGKNVTIYQNVTLGRKNKDIPEYPTIEDDVIIYCNSTVIGNVTIGKGAVIGCNSVVLRDVKPGEVVSGIVK